MIKGLFGIALGAAGALALDRWAQRQKTKLSTTSVTGNMIDRANRRLEARRASQPTGPGTEPVDS